MKITEQNFITQIIQGNEKALEYCMYHYGGLVRAVVRRHLGSLSKFEDECINDVFFCSMGACGFLPVGQESFFQLDCRRGASEGAGL